MEDFKLVEKTPPTYGKDTNSILYDLFGVSSRPAHAKNEFKKLYKLIDDPAKEKEAAEMLKMLEEKYGKHDPDLMDAKLSFEFLTDWMKYIQKNIKNEPKSLKEERSTPNPNFDSCNKEDIRKALLREQGYISLL